MFFFLSKSALILSGFFLIILVFPKGARCDDDDPPAKWMSGKFGMGFRIMAGDFLERHEPHWGPVDWSLLVDQFTSVGASHVIVNLSEGAYGSTWMGHHPTLYSINTPTDTACVPNIGGNGWDANCQTAPTQSLAGDRDYFLEMMLAFRKENIKVIVYVASQGPAMFKAGSNFAFDVLRRTTPIRGNDCTSFGPNDGPAACFAEPDNCCSPSIGNWIKYVKDLNSGTIDYPKLHKAYADVIIGYYANIYKEYIDGWWFDHATENGSCGAGSTCRKDFIDKAAVKSAIREYQPNVPIAFNTCSNAQKSPLQICAPNFEDFTAGHPKPLGGGNPTMPFDSANYPMVTSIEGTNGGFFQTAEGWKSLGHVFMPTGTAWNGPTITNVWTTPYPYTTPYVYSSTDWGDLVTTEEGWNPNAATWFQRSLAAGGSWTWNLPRQSNDQGTFFLLHPNHLAVVAYAASLLSSSTAPSTSTSPSSSPVEGPTECREDGNDLFYKGEEGGNRPCKMLLKAKEKKGEWMLDQLCAKTESSTYGPPSEVCKVSCNTCPGGCGESSTRRFYHKMLKSGVIETKSCKWLAALSNDNGQVDTICNFVPPPVSDSTLAGRVCPNTCGTCPGLPRPDSCDEKTQDRFYFRTTKGGKIKSKNCFWLKKLPSDSKRLKSICAIALPEGAKVACPITCGTCNSSGSNVFEPL